MSLKPIIINSICVFVLMHPSTGAAQARVQAANPLAKTASDVISATLSYRLALERVLAVYERELVRRAELADLRQDLFEREVLSKQEFEDGQRADLQARRNVDETRAAILDTDRMLTEARMAETLARLTPLPRGAYDEMPGLVRFNGPGRWSLTVDTQRLREFFLGRFGRILPISAFGQTPLHDRMGFDHRNALDVAVHPDSPEGRSLMEHLREEGIPFIAAWGPIPGSTSGAHIHVGQPSPRVSTGP